MNPLEKTQAAPFEAVIARVTEALKAEGFGVLTTIDVKDTLEKKLDVEFRRYTILGACNPRYAHQALLLSLDVGTLLPCTSSCTKTGHAPWCARSIRSARLARSTTPGSRPSRTRFAGSSSG